MKNNFEKTILISLNTAIIALIAFFLISLVVVISTSYLNFQWDYIGLSHFVEIYKIPLAALAVLGAILTLRLTAKRVLQTDKQLELITKQIQSVYRPDLFIKTNEIIFISHKIRDDDVNDLVLTTSGFVNEEAYLEIFNGGFGVAKDILYEYKFSLDSAIDLMKKLEEKLKNDVLAISITKLKNDRLKIESLAKFEHFKGYEEQWESLKEEIIYLLPSKTSESHITIPFPRIYGIMFMVYLHNLNIYRLLKTKEGKYLYTEMNIWKKRLSLFPELILEINYSDVGGKEYERSFSIGFQYRGDDIFSIFNEHTINDNNLELRLIISELIGEIE